MYKCPFCNASIAKSYETVRESDLGFDYAPYDEHGDKHKHYTFEMIRCPECEKINYKIKGVKEPFNTYGEVSIFPRSRAVKFPDYIPEQLRQDYEEAYAILELSPKASATLSRRCLQGIIRDFHKIKPDTLYKEISQLEGVIPASQYKVLHSLRQLGNIGAHFEKDVSLIVEIDVDEAEKLIKLIEYLFEKWYIEQKETEDLFRVINETNDEKKEIRKSISES